MVEFPIFERVMTHSEIGKKICSDGRLHCGTHGSSEWKRGSVGERGYHEQEHYQVERRQWVDGTCFWDDWMVTLL